MIVSLAEITVVAARATRGGGHFWGIAEEMACAVPWLCARRLNGVLVLATALESYQEPVYDLVEKTDELQFIARDKAGLAALRLAPSVADFLAVYSAPAKAVTLSSVVSPLLLWPFLSQLSSRPGQVFV